MGHNRWGPKQEVLGEKELERRKGALVVMRHYKVNYTAEQSRGGKKTGDVQMGRGRDIPQEDVPRHLVSRSVWRVPGTQEEQVTRAGQWEEHRTVAEALRQPNLQGSRFERPDAV